MAGFVSKCWRWCSIRWFFWKNAFPHSQTWVRTVQPPFGCRRLCCIRPCLAANPLPQLAQKCDLGLLAGDTVTTCCCCCCWTCCRCCCPWTGIVGTAVTTACGWVELAACTSVVCDITWPVDDMICTGTGLCPTRFGLAVTTVPGLRLAVLKKWPGSAAVKAHRSVIKLLSPVCSRKCKASASRLLNALPHSLQIEKLSLANLYALLKAANTYRQTNCGRVTPFASVVETVSSVELAGLLTTVIVCGCPGWWCGCWSCLNFESITNVP